MSVMSVHAVNRIICELTCVPGTITNRGTITPSDSITTCRGYHVNASIDGSGCSKGSNSSYCWKENSEEEWSYGPFPVPHYTVTWFEPDLPMWFTNCGEFHFAAKVKAIPNDYLRECTNVVGPLPAGTLTVKVVAVVDATVIGAIPIDDGDSSSNTTAYVTCLGTDDVTVTATPCPGLSEPELPDCWDASGGNGTSKLIRTVSKTNCATTSVGFSAGNSWKIVTVTVVAVGGASASGATPIDDGDGNPDTQAYMVCKGTGDVTVTATPCPAGLAETNLPSCWTTDGGIGADKLIRTVPKETCDTKTVKFTAGASSKSITVHVVESKINQPVGSLGADPNPPSSWLSSSPYHFDFQGVVSGSPGPYAIDIAGMVCPTPAASYKWTLDSGAGSLTGDTTATPTHIPPASPGQGTLALRAMIGTNDTGCGKTRALKIYLDHLARDRENFGTGISCWQNWQFVAHGVTNTMSGTWNCHGSTVHHYNGSGSGSAGPSAIAFVQNWTPAADVTVTHQEGGGGSHPSLGTLDRGDVVIYYTAGGDVMHSQTCTGSGTETYGANNEPLSYPGLPGHTSQGGNESYRWAASPAGDWANNLWLPNTGIMPVRIKVFRKP
jgi:hypothetical protein